MANGDKFFNNEKKLYIFLLDLHETYYQIVELKKFNLSQYQNLSKRTNKKNKQKDIKIKK